MEIKSSPISIEDRIDYLNSISENQQKNQPQFPWVVAIISFFAGALLILGYLWAKEDKPNGDSTKAT